MLDLLNLIKELKFQANYGRNNEIIPPSHKSPGLFPQQIEILVQGDNSMSIEVDHGQGYP
jgi:hypothetical protein